MLDIKHLDVAYGEVQVLFDISIHVEDGENMALIGPNGAGKSTLFRTISGNRPPLAGEILYRGQSIANLSPNKILRNGICHVPQEDNIFPGLTVEENISIGGYTIDEEKKEEMIDIIYDLFPRMEERSNQLGSTLSGGERQMLAIARGLMSDPDLLLLDEPTAGLAPHLVDEVFERIESIHAKTGVTVFLVEQRVLETLDFADHVFVLENGRIKTSGPPEQLQEEENLREAYLGI